jgi:hypothetical protein
LEIWTVFFFLLLESGVMIDYTEDSSGEGGLGSSSLISKKISSFSTRVFELLYFLSSYLA